MEGVVNLSCEPYTAESVDERADIVFYGAAAQVAHGDRPRIDCRGVNG